MKRQQVRSLTILSSLLLFPIIMNFLSPYLIVNGAFEGVLAGSGITFLSLFLFSLITGRLFCGWLCPMGGLNEALLRVNNKRVTSKGMKVAKYIIWGIWGISIIGGFIFSGGIKAIKILYMTESGISIDAPIKYITYYGVIMIFLLISILGGRRASCHCICWIAPFMIFGKKLSDLIGLPRLHVQASKGCCIHCNKCTNVCPMSIPVMEEDDQTFLRNDDCIQCGMCVDHCPKKCFSYQFNKIDNK